jgi:hypothetical protein
MRRMKGNRNVDNVVTVIVKYVSMIKEKHILCSVDENLGCKQSK